ncbi:hypothetical protein Tco_0162306 [Tanacetum coccineum]
MSLGTKLGDHIDEFNKLILDLANINIEIEDEDQTLMLLTSLSSSYENFVETLFYRRESLTMKDVLVKLILVEVYGSSEGAKLGKRDQDFDSFDDEGNAYFEEALVVVENDKMTELVIDSGGSYHMTHMRDFLYDFKGFNGGLVELGDNRTCTIKGTGKVKIQLHDGSSFILKDVRYAPGLRRSLISLVNTASRVVNTARCYCQGECSFLQFSDRKVSLKEASSGLNPNRQTVLVVYWLKQQVIAAKHNKRQHVCKKEASLVYGV